MGICACGIIVIDFVPLRHYCDRSSCRKLGHLQSIAPAQNANRSSAPASPTSKDRTGDYSSIAHVKTASAPARLITLLLLRISKFDRTSASKTVTSKPSVSKLLVRLDPTKPAPPVTRTRLVIAVLPLGSDVEPRIVRLRPPRVSTPREAVVWHLAYVNLTDANVAETCCKKGTS